jgi:hypothetical protein
MAIQEIAGLETDVHPDDIDGRRTRDTEKHPLRGNGLLANAVL